MNEKDAAQHFASSLGWPQAGDIVRHYKGGLYVVMCRSVDEETLEPLVTYRSAAKKTWWTRTMKNFTQMIAAGDRDVSRFAPVEE